MGCRHGSGHNHRYCCSDCGEPLPASGYAMPSVPYGALSREEYVRELEHEREMLQRRLSRLERELDELRAPTTGASR
jgi:hypothetical protein